MENITCNLGNGKNILVAIDPILGFCQEDLLPQALVDTLLYNENIYLDDIYQEDNRDYCNAGLMTT